jgi:hypothetical protein
VTKPLTPAERVSRSRARALEAGAVAVPYTVLRDPIAIAALARLREQHGSLRAALEHALKSSGSI